MSEINYFDNLQSVDCSRFIEKKGGLSYLSWPFAVAALKHHHPTATWKVREYLQPGVELQRIPYCITPAGAFVCVEVTVDGVTHEQIHPVLDNKNKTIANPNAFEVNTSIMRCLVKCIALHGLGLSIYAGEDLPMELPAGENEKAEAQATKVAQWLGMIRDCAPDAMPQLKKDLLLAFGGDRKFVPATLAKAYVDRMEAIKAAEEQADAAAQS